MPTPLSPPWSQTIDLTDPEHCYGPVADIVSDLGEPARAHLGDAVADPDTLTHDDLRRIVDAAVRELEAGAAPANLDPDVLPALEEAQERLLEHLGCQCGLDTWDTFLAEDVNTSIADTAPGKTWVLWLYDTVRAVFPDGFTVAEAWAAMNSRDGWDHLDLAWDPQARTLRLAIGAYPSVWVARAVIPSDEQVARADELCLMGFEREHAYQVAMTSPLDAIDVAVRLWEPDAPGPGALAHRFTYLDDAINEVTARMRDLDPTARQVVVSLAPGWQHGLEDLLVAATGVLATA
jgi:hypothetical protein